MGRRRPVAMLALLPLLAGCVTIHGQFELGGDGTSRYDLTVVVLRASAGATQDAPVLFCNDFQRIFPPGVVIDTVEDGGHVSCRLSGTAPTAELGDRLERSTGAVIRHEEGSYRFIWDPRSDPSLAEGVDDFEFSVTFPGEVLEHSGSSTVSGTTVTWRDPADLFTPGGLSAAGLDRGRPWPAFLAATGLVLGLGAMLALAGRVARRRRADEAGSAPLSSWPPPSPHARVAGAGFLPAGERLPPQAWAPGPPELSHRPAPEVGVDPGPETGRAEPPPPSPWAPPA
ncbi:MAG: hypothetical protein AAGC63_09115 [Propionicimonas sp.]|nr:hypothetical protein [Propionicimonas sp.]